MIVIRIRLWSCLHTDVFSHLRWMTRQLMSTNSIGQKKNITETNDVGPSTSFFDFYLSSRFCLCVWARQLIGTTTYSLNWESTNIQKCITAEKLNLDMGDGRMQPHLFDTIPFDGLPLAPRLDEIQYVCSFLTELVLAWTLDFMTPAKIRNDEWCFSYELLSFLLN